jgi:hypothetical protein
MSHRAVGCEDVDWIEVAQDQVSILDLREQAMNFHVLHELYHVQTSFFDLLEVLTAATVKSTSGML